MAGVAENSWGEVLMFGVLGGSLPKKVPG